MNQLTMNKINEELLIENEQEDKVREQIVSNFGNMLIEAGAGSGKTSIIVNRIIEQLISTDIDISQIVAITFTNKAADELKGRFQWELLKRVEEETDEISKQKLNQAVERMDRMQISTIHSFCNSMLIEMPFEAGISLDSRLMEGIEENELIKRFFYDYCGRKLGSLKDINIVEEELLTTFIEMCRKNVDEWCYDTSIKTNGAIKRASILKEAGDCFNAIKDCYLSPKQIKNGKVFVTKSFQHADIMNLGSVNFSTPVIREAGKRCYEIACKGAPIDEKSMEALLALEKPPKTKDGIIKLKLAIGRKDTSKVYAQDMPELAKAAYDASADISEKIFNCRKKWQQYRNDRCVEFLAPAYSEYVQYKKNNSIMNNDDLLVITRDMLKTSDTAREYFRNKYRYIYIDEFQDTDPVQADILKLLVCKDGSQTSFEENKFCVIGDPKQSIYSFRGADIRQYMDVKKLMEEADNCIICKMYRNYRSSQEICSWVEKKFTVSQGNSFGFTSPEASTSVDLTQPSMEKILTTQEPRDTDKVLSGVVQQYVVGANREAIVVDATNVISIIERIVGNKKIPAYDKHERSYVTRTVQYSDFLILTWNTKNMDYYVKTLKEKNIPVLISGNTRLRNVPEVDSFLMMLEYLSKPYDFYRFSLVVNKVFGIAITDDLKQYLNKIWNSEEIETIPDSSLREALLALNHYLKSNYDAPMQMVEALADDMKLWLCRHDYSEKELRYILGNVEQLLEAVRETEHGTLADIVDIMTAAAENPTDREMVIHDEELSQDGGAVRIMNLHKAKGLEGNIVFLANPTTEYEKKEPVVIIDEDKGYVNVKYGSDFNLNYAKSLGGNAEYDIINDKVEKLRMEEEVRLLYVACTRAREVLFISIYCSKQNGISSKYVWNPLYTKKEAKEEQEEEQAEKQEEKQEEEQEKEQVTNEPSTDESEPVDLDAGITFEYDENMLQKREGIEK